MFFFGVLNHTLFRFRSWVLADIGEQLRFDYARDYFADLANLSLTFCVEVGSFKLIWSNCGAVNADRCYNSVYICVRLRLKLCFPFSETSLFKDIGTTITGITGFWKTHKDRMCSLNDELYEKTLLALCIKKKSCCIKEE